MSYKVEITKSALKELKNLPKPVWKRVKTKLEPLHNYPNLQGIVDIKGYKNLYRLRVGDYRIVFLVDNDKVKVLVVKIGHRKHVYK